MQICGQRIDLKYNAMQFNPMMDDRVSLDQIQNLQGF